MIEAVSGLLPRPSASFIMRSHHWHGTRVISHRSAKHESRSRPHIILRGRTAAYELTREKFIVREGKEEEKEEESAGREQRARSNIPQNFKFSRGRVRLSWKHIGYSIWNFVTREHFNQELYRAKRAFSQN